MADSLGRNQSSISREVFRNTGQRGDRNKQAENFVQDRHKNKHKDVKLTVEIKGIINGYIVKDWSPEQAAGRLKEDGIISLHHETIYPHILVAKKTGGELYKHLRHQNKTYRKCIGDWEADTIIGKNHKGAIVTLDERKSKLRLAFPLSGKKAQPVLDATVLMLDPIKNFVKTITFDNGKEFTLHEKIAEALGCDTYFAKPYSSWERGQNENANGLLRQYFPKAMELVDVTTKDVFKAIHKLNSRPKKCLGYKTPYEAFEELTGIDIKNLLGYALMT